MPVSFKVMYYNTTELDRAKARGEEIDKTDWTHYASHDEGKDAAEQVKVLKASHPHLTWSILRDDPTAGDADWRTREMQRFFEGTYKKIEGRFPIEKPDDLNRSMYDSTWQRDWAGRSIHDKLMEDYPSLCAHISRSNARKIAYTKDNEKGRKDIQTTLNAIEFVSRCISWDETLKGYIIEAAGGYNVNLQFASEPKDIADIYMKCDDSREVGSCMSHPTSSYSTYGTHPAEVYGGGDLQLCYAKDEDGTIWGRCLVWPEQKRWGRIYSTNAALMRKALKAAGYESGEAFNSLIGARLQLIRLDDDEIVMPYIDNTYRANLDAEGNLTIAGEDGNIEASNTCGTARTRATFYCDKCEDHVTDHDDNQHEVQNETWCQPCYENYASYCEDCCETYSNDNTRSADCGETYCEDCYHSRFTDCDDCESEQEREALTYDETSGQSLCTDCHDSLIEAREESEAAELEAANSDQAELELEAEAA